MAYKGAFVGVATPFEKPPPGGTPNMSRRTTGGKDRSRTPTAKMRSFFTNQKHEEQVARFAAAEEQLQLDMQKRMITMGNNEQRQAFLRRLGIARKYLPTECLPCAPARIFIKVSPERASLFC